MAAIANTYVTGDVVGIREDLSDVISNISPTETPFTSNAGKGPKPKNTFYEWQLDALASADNTNAQAEGDDVTSFAAAVPTTRVGNYCQISRKELILSDTQEAVDAAGRDSELAYQIAKRGKELKRDIEKIACGTNQGADGSDPRKTATLLSYVQTNDILGEAGAPASPAAPNPTYAGTRTDGTQRAFTEALVQACVQLMYAAGANIDGSTIMVGPFNKSVFSGFAGIATQYRQNSGTKQGTILGASDVYVSDFGTLTAMPNRFSRDRDAWILDFDLIKMRDLRPYRVVDLAKTGDATKKMLLREWSLQIENEAGLGLVADLTTM